MFYTFNQSNPGGSYDYDEKDGITHYVIVEADNYNDAISKAESIGVYFNGVSKGLDCSCCNDRWFEQSDESGDVEPTIYDTPLKEFKPYPWSKGDKQQVCVHYKDGRKEWYHGNV